jgi:membrane protein implicated in regulation of membrane protease activity
VHPPDLGDLVNVSRVARVGRLVLTLAVLVVVGGVAFAVAAVATPTWVRWGTAAILLVLLAATMLLCAHAGGHAWFVPVPAIALAVVWAFTASAGSPVAGWWLVALCATAVAVGVVVASTALRQRLRGTLVGFPSLRGTDGVAVTALAPLGVVQVAGEKWSAESVSGQLPAGAPVHVLGVRGVRLEVWSEMGTVPDSKVLDTEEDQS